MGERSCNEPPPHAIMRMRHCQDLLSRDRNAGAHRQSGGIVSPAQIRYGWNSSAVSSAAYPKRISCTAWPVVFSRRVLASGTCKGLRGVSDESLKRVAMRTTYTQKSGWINTCQKSTDHAVALLHSALESAQRAISRNTSRGPQSREHLSSRDLPDIKWV